MRESDTTSIIHGDEGLSVFPNTNKYTAHNLMNELTNNLQYKNPQTGKLINIEVSYGIVEFNGSKCPKETLVEDIIENMIKEADKRMYEHKRSKNTKN